MLFGKGRQQGGKPRPGKRVRTPTILQMEAVECGAAALAIILAHFGRWVPLEKLRIVCGVSRDGSKASNIVKAARSYGLVAKGFKKEPGDLRTLTPPMIIHWNFNHFIVLEGIRKGKVYLNDPGLGPLIMTEEELDQAFTGVVLTFEREPGFKPGGEPPRLLGSLKKRLVAARAALAFVVLVGLALVVPGLVVPVFSKVFVDSVLLEGRHDWLQPLLLAMGITALLTAALTWMQQTYLLRLEIEDGPVVLQPLPLARAASAGGVFQPALPWRRQLPRGDQRPRGSAPLPRSRHQRPGRVDDRVLRGADVPVRSPVDPGGGGHRLAQHGRPAFRLAQAGRSQLPPFAGAGQAPGHRHRRLADDRDDQGVGRRGRSLRALGRLPGQGGQHPAGARALHPASGRRTTAARRSQQRRRAGPRRPAGDERRRSAWAGWSPSRR